MCIASKTVDLKYTLKLSFAYYQSCDIDPDERLLATFSG